MGREGERRVCVCVCVGGGGGQRAVNITRPNRSSVH